MVLGEEGSIADVDGTVHVCRDPEDDMVIETAINGRADVLVSHDDGLKRSPEVAAALREHNIQVLTVQRFSTLSARQRLKPTAEGTATGDVDLRTAAPCTCKDEPGR